ncbi:hypothetical protein J1TS5_24170 [Paenibacillus macerans]|nr:hypothetical protein J1TS5_24170 [Paenibacillus macerans]
MKAVTYQGIKNIAVKEVPAPKIEKPDDMIIKISSSAICGSDLHLLHGMIPNLRENYIRGRTRGDEAEERRPGHHPLYDRLRRMFLLQKPSGKPMRQCQ